MPILWSINESRQGSHYADLVPVKGPLIPDNSSEPEKVTSYIEIEQDTGQKK